MKQLPKHVREQLPCTKIKNTIFDNELIELVASSITTGTSFRKMAIICNDINMDNYYLKMDHYISMMTRMDIAKPTQGSVITDYFKPVNVTKPKIPPFPAPDLYKFKGKAIKKMFIWHSVMNQEWRDNFMKSLSATIIKVDATYRERKLIAKDDPIVPDTECRFNVLNDFGQVVGYWLAQADSYHLVMPALQAVFFI